MKICQTFIGISGLEVTCKANKYKQKIIANCKINLNKHWAIPYSNNSDDKYLIFITGLPITFILFSVSLILFETARVNGVLTKLVS